MTKQSRSYYLPVFVGLRYAGIKSDTHLLSFLARVAMLGLVLGTALLIVVLSVMNGFDRELRERILHIVPHISFYHTSANNKDDNGTAIDWHALEKKIAEDADVREVIPFVEIEGLLKTAGDAEPLLFYGVESYPALHAYIKPDERAAWEANETGILISAYTAEKMHLALQDSVLGVLSVYPAPGHHSDTGRPEKSALANSVLLNMALQKFQVAGIFNTKTELDKVLVIAHRSVLERASGLDQPQGLRVSLHDLFKAPAVQWRLMQLMPVSFYGKNWSQTHGNLYEAVQMSRSLVSLLMFVIIAVAVFNVVSTLVLVVIEKKQSIAILRVQGASTQDVVRIFMVQGTFIGVVGSCIGALIGIVISLLLPETVALLERLFHFQILQADVYPITYIPADLRLLQVLFVVGVAMAFSFVASLYPAWRATRIDPAQVLRYE